MEISLPAQLQSVNDIYNYGFDKNLYRGTVESPIVYDIMNPTEAEIVQLGALMAGSGTKSYQVSPEKGMWLGGERFDDAPFKVNMSGDLTSTSLALTGGVIKYGKTTFTDSNNAGYYLSSEGVYVGAADDVSKIKYTIGSSLDITKARYITKYTAGETIIAGRLLCVKNSETTKTIEDSVILADTYVDAAYPNSNYGSNSGGSVGCNDSGAMWHYMRFNFTSTPPNLPSWNNVDKVLLYINIYGNTLTQTRTVKVYLVTQTWNENTLTWNNKPTNSTVPYLTFTVAAGFSGYKELDITELYYADEANDGISAFGFVFQPDWGAVEHFLIRSKEGSSSQPYIKYIRNDESDGKVYHADWSDYNKVKNIVGIALTSGNANDTIDVQNLIDGTVFTTSGLTAGQTYYLRGTAGELSSLATTIDTDYWVIKVGYARSSTELIIDTDKRPKFIKSLTHYFGYGSSTPDYYTNIRAREAIAVWSTYFVESGLIYYYRGEFYLRKDRITSAKQRSTSLSGATTHYGGADISWTTNYIRVNADCSNTISTNIDDNNKVTIYFYE